MDNERKGGTTVHGVRGLDAAENLPKSSILWGERLTGFNTKVNYSQTFYHTLVSFRFCLNIGLA